MDTLHAVGNSPLNQPQHADNKLIKSPCRVGLIALGVILMIGSAAAAGVLYSHLGFVSLSCLGALPVGIALIVAGARCGRTSSSSSSSSSSIVTHGARFARLNGLPWAQLVESEERVTGLFPVDTHYNTNETQQKLRALNQDSLLIVGQVLDVPRLCLLDNSQLNFLPWAQLVESEEKLAGLFPMDTHYNMNETQQKLRALNQDSLLIVGQALDVPRLRLLDNSQLKYLPWKEIVKSKEKLAGLFPMDTHYNMNETQQKLRALDKDSQSILFPHLSVEQIGLLIS